MIICGIDPGLAHTGIGIINKRPNRCDYIFSGEIRTNAGEAQNRRLCTIFDDLYEILAEYRPDVIAIERMPFAPKFRTASAVNEVIGVIKVVSGKTDNQISEYSPAEIKGYITGTGKADKFAVIESVKQILEIDEIALSDHAADALAVALTHAKVLD